MRFFLERVSDPDEEPVTLEEMKRYLRVTSSDEDDDIQMLITVAREWVEYYTGRAMFDQTWRLTIGETVSLDVVDGGSILNYMYGVVEQPVTMWTVSGIPLRRSPILSIGAISTIDSAGTETELQDVGSPEVPIYRVSGADSKWPTLLGLSSAQTEWTAGQLRVEFRAGFANREISPQEAGEVVPAVLKQAIKLIVAHYFENREPVNIGNIVSEIPMGVKWLLASQLCNIGFA